ncbi:MAG: phage holin family protein [Burkholderiaceae bacterium]|nr:phage holin family protein [Burkholderiaceae bacterium]
MTESASDAARTASGGAGTRRAAGLLDAARRLGGSALSLANTRLALAFLDLSEERDRLLRLAMFAVAAATMIALALVAATALVVVAFWDDYRLHALAGATLANALAAWWSVRRVRALVREAPPLLETTLAELERDAQVLRK